MLTNALRPNWSAEANANHETEVFIRLFYPIQFNSISSDTKRLLWRDFQTRPLAPRSLRALYLWQEELSYELKLKDRVVTSMSAKIIAISCVDFLKRIIIIAPKIYVQCTFLFIVNFSILFCWYIIVNFFKRSHLHIRFLLLLVFSGESESLYYCQ